MFIATLIHHTWLANDLADIRDDFKSARRNVKRLLSDCYHYTFNCMSVSIGDYINGSQRTDGKYAFYDPDVGRAIPRAASYRRAGLFAVGVAGGLLTALWLQRRTRPVYRKHPLKTKRMS